MRRGAGRSRPPDPLNDAMRSLIRGPDRAGALVFLLMFGYLVVIPGSAVLYVAASFSGPSELTGKSSLYLEFASGSFVLAAICFLLSPPPEYSPSCAG